MVESSQGRASFVGSPPSDEEVDNFSRSTKKVKTDGMEGNPKRGSGGEEEG